MKFQIKKTYKTEQRLLHYDSEDYAFDMEPVVNAVAFNLVLNYLNLSVDLDNKIVQIWGYCPYTSWMPKSITVPEYVKGELIVMSELKPGFSYSINQDEREIYVNYNTGWICIGNPEKKNNAVEFINDCIAILEDEELVSLWLKPIALPKI